ncbi:hypothetical protein ACFWAZ_13810 [Streptomyces collinus]|uniref:hypothetical protein n=1 Tax=Streptomyces collinus TaxID=42684 RepID=UPI00364E6FC9
MGRGAQFRGRLLVDAAEFEAQRGGQAELTVVTVVEGDLGADSGAGRPTSSRWRPRPNSPGGTSTTSPPSGAGSPCTLPGIGHNVPQEAPEAFAQAVVDAGHL